MRSRCLPIILLLGLATGCNRTATTDPFAREEDPNVEIQGLAVVVAGAVGQLGMAFNDSTARLTGNSPRYLEWARAMANPDAPPDELRESMLGLVRYDYGRRAPYTEAYRQFAEKSPHALVRATAIRALSISRDKSAGPLLVTALKDEAPSVRLEAAKALANLPDAAGTERLLSLAENADEPLDVRIASIDALKHAGDPESLRRLVNLLEADDFSLAWQARRSLVTATGKDHGFDALEWRKAMV